MDIFDAVMGGDLNNVKKIINSEKASVMARDNSQNTPLHIAANYNYSEIAELLIKKGADVNAVNGDLKTPMYCTLRVNLDNNIAQLLLLSGARLCASKSKKTPLIDGMTIPTNPQIQQQQGFLVDGLEKMNAINKCDKVVIKKHFKGFKSNNPRFCGEIL